MCRKEVHPSKAIAGALTIYASTKRGKIAAFVARNLYQDNLAAIDREMPRVLFMDTFITAAVFCHLNSRRQRSTTLMSRTGFV